MCRARLEDTGIPGSSFREDWHFEPDTEGGLGQRGLAAAGRDRQKRRYGKHRYVLCRWLSFKWKKGDLEKKLLS